MQKVVLAGAGFAACAAFVAFGGGTAAAAKALPDVDGESWSNAQNTLKADSFTASVASTIGDHEKWGDCEVTDVREAAQFINSMDNVTVSLNCDAKPTKKS